MLAGPHSPFNIAQGENLIMETQKYGTRVTGGSSGIAISLSRLSPSVQKDINGPNKALMHVI